MQTKIRFFVIYVHIIYFYFFCDVGARLGRETAAGNNEIIDPSATIKLPMRPKHQSISYTYMDFFCR